MVILKIFVTFLIAFIYKTNEFSLLFHTYSVEVTGNFECGNYKGTVLVLISKNPDPYSLRDTLASKLIDYRSLLKLEVRNRSFRRPRLYLKLIHKCGVRAKGQFKAFIMEIPASFIVNGRKKCGPLSLIGVNLNQLPKQYTLKRKTGSMCRKNNKKESGNTNTALYLSNFKYF